jgi:glycopeptide antibiotics resistance protein
MKTSDPKHSALSYALLIYIVIVVILITLIPFDFRIPEKIHIFWSTNFLDFITNIMLFLPVGFLFSLSRRKNKDLFCIDGLVFGIFLSLAIESAQAFVPGRYTSLIDIITNGIGAWVGAISFVVLKKSLKEDRAVRLLALELPLMNLAYFIIPLMWLNGLSMGKEFLRLWLMLLLGLFGGGVLSSIYIYRLKGARALGPNKLSCFTIGWFYIGAIQMLTRYPLRIVIFGAIIGAVSQILARLPIAGSKDERRFELPTLKRLLPLYVIYLLLVAAWPTTVPLNQWQAIIHFQELTFDERIVFTFRFIELIAAFTLLGYLIAEMRGRKNESSGKTLAWTVLAALSTSVIIAVLEGFSSLVAVNILETGIITAASLYGAVIYRLQLAAIQRL